MEICMSADGVGWAQVLYALVEQGLSKYDVQQFGVAQYLYATGTFWFSVLACGLMSLGHRIIERGYVWLFRPQVLPGERQHPSFNIQLPSSSWPVFSLLSLWPTLPSSVGLGEKPQPGSAHLCPALPAAREQPAHGPVSARSPPFFARCMGRWSYADSHSAPPLARTGWSSRRWRRPRQTQRWAGRRACASPRCARARRASACPAAPSAAPRRPTWPECRCSPSCPPPPPPPSPCSPCAPARGPPPARRTAASSSPTSTCAAHPRPTVGSGAAVGASLTRHLHGFLGGFTFFSVDRTTSNCFIFPICSQHCEDGKNTAFVLHNLKGEINFTLFLPANLSFLLVYRSL